MTGIAIVAIVWIFVAVFQVFLQHSNNHSSREKLWSTLSLVVAIIMTLYGVAYTFWEYLMQPPDITPYNYEEVYQPPVEIEMQIHGTLLPDEIPFFDIYYTTDGSDPMVSESAIKYEGPFVIEESTSFSARCLALGFLWGELLTPSPYYRVTVEKEEFIDVEDIVINGPTSMYVGGTGMMFATIYPANATDQKVYWFSSDPGIAAVDRKTGEICAVAASEKPVEITAKTNSGKSSDPIKLIVQKVETPSGGSSSSSSGGGGPIKPPPPPSLSHVEISPDYLSLTEGESRSLSMTPYPLNVSFNNVIWESLDPDIVSVTQDGLVTAICQGTTSISVSVDDFYDVITVEVSPRIIEIEDIGASVSYVELQAYGPSEYVEAWVIPANATDQQLYWYSDDEDVVHVTNDGELIPGAAGNTTVHVTDWSERYDHCIEVTVEVSPRIIEIEDIGASVSYVELQAYGPSEYVEAWVIPADATDQRLYWYSDDEDVVHVTNDGELIPGAAGNTTVHVTDWSERYDHCIEVEVTDSSIPPVYPIDPSDPNIEPKINVFTDRYLVASDDWVEVSFDITTPDHRSEVWIEYLVYPDDSNYILLDNDSFFTYYEYMEVWNTIRICPEDYGLSPGIYTFYVSLEEVTENGFGRILDSDTFQIEVY